MHHQISNRQAAGTHGKESRCARLGRRRRGLGVRSDDYFEVREEVQNRPVSLTTHQLDRPQVVLSGVLRNKIDMAGVLIRCKDGRLNNKGLSPQDTCKLLTVPILR